MFNVYIFLWKDMVHDMVFLVENPTRPQDYITDVKKR